MGWRRGEGGGRPEQDVKLLGRVAGESVLALQEKGDAVLSRTLNCSGRAAGESVLALQEAVNHPKHSVLSRTVNCSGRVAGESVFALREVVT